MHGARKLTVGALAIATAAIGLVAAPAGAGTHYPVPYNFGAGIVAEAVTPGAAPPGANDFSCTPSAAHPYPVVLVHGTFGDMTDSWQALSPLLANDGFCVFALNYGGAAGDPIQATGAIESSAAQLAAFVTTVLSATHARQVDIVGHSQGGMMPRYYIDFLRGASKVHALVGLAPSNHGTTLFGVSTLASAFPGGVSAVPGCDACSEQMAGSAFLAHLNAGSETRPHVAYTVIESKYDDVVTPYTSAFLNGPGVTNITLQNQCPIDFGDHLAIIYDPVALADVVNALDPAHPTPPPCVPVVPVLGG
jgi:triacylglycerol esterase/lipase EstA (alpha/beta hydrolase family)